ncbi:hypothetical protein [Pseudomonas vranovensis]|uniref:Uncharacterized protein n=1 Tax=Pseudomonas vranovensis TaxID=321661 RepID=A0A423DM92_9PSED|nr:hypothetical protein [Pseudomonas vranovensis]ROL72654.1 hypothetical protein BHU25_13640 [Pseudomonas vranovensis]
MSFGSHEGMDQALHDSIMKPCAEKPGERMAFISFKMSAGGVAELIEDDLFNNVTLTKLNMQV